MRAVITRKMVVANDYGSPKQFQPSTEEQPFEEVTDTVFRRLKRAGAAEIYRGDASHADGGEESPDPEKLSKVNLIEFAQAKGIEVDASATRAVILETVKAALAAA